MDAIRLFPMRLYISNLHQIVKRPIMLEQNIQLGVAVDQVEGSLEKNEAVMLVGC